MEGDVHRLLRDLGTVNEGLTPDNLLETYHDALDLRDQAMLLFNTGQLGLDERAQ